MNSSITPTYRSFPLENGVGSQKLFKKCREEGETQGARSAETGMYK